MALVASPRKTYARSQHALRREVTGVALERLPRVMLARCASYALNARSPSRDSESGAFCADSSVLLIADSTVVAFRLPENLGLLEKERRECEQTRIATSALRAIKP